MNLKINQVYHLKKEFKVIKNIKKIKRIIHMHQKIPKMKVLLNRR